MENFMVQNGKRSVAFWKPFRGLTSGVFWMNFFCRAERMVFFSGIQIPAGLAGILRM